eukprot:scaffold128798_cov40-Tisochrysis_lutea.AAC.4
MCKLIKCIHGKLGHPLGLVARAQRRDNSAYYAHCRYPTRGGLSVFSYSLGAQGHLGRATGARTSGNTWAS